MLSRAVTLASMVGLVAAMPMCGTEFLGGQRMFVVEQENGKNRRMVPAIEGTTDAKTFYSYSSHSSHTGLERVGVSIMFLYRDVNDANGVLDFFWIHGKEQGTQKNAEVDGLISGIPNGVTIAQTDDVAHPGHEFRFTDSHQKGVWTGPNVPGPRAAGRWRFSSNTDGGALTGLEKEKDWELKVEVDLRKHMNSWEFLFGDGSNPLVLDPLEPTYLRTVQVAENEVLPYPQEVTTNTYCTTAKNEVLTDTSDLEYTFSWGDETPDTVVVKAPGVPACAEHTFCGPLSATCGGTFPRSVRVTVKTTKSGCGPTPPEEEILALETCVDGVKVTVDGVHVAPSSDGGVAAMGLHKIPEQFDGMTLFTPTGGVAKDSVVELKCCGEEECSFVVSTYHCPPCGRNGGFPATLPTNGFAAGSCAPHFKNDQKMTSFYTTVPAGDSLTLPEAVVAAPYVAVFGKRGALDAWCPKPTRPGCGGPCKPTFCDCDFDI